LHDAEPGLVSFGGHALQLLIGYETPAILAMCAPSRFFSRRDRA